MKVAIKVVMMAALFMSGLGLGKIYGVQREERYVEATCNNVNTDTIINGTHYVCLTAEQWNGLFGKLKERGA